MQARQAAATARYARALERFRRLGEQEATIMGLLSPGVARPLPNYGEVVDDIVKTGSVELSRWCAHALQAIEDGVMSTVKFKIGITAGPKHRWLNCRYGYYTTETWRFMRLLVEGTARECSYLERRLIAYGRSEHPGMCENHAPGGEGISHDARGPHWVYIVFETDPTEPRRGLRWHYQGHRASCVTCQRYEEEDAAA